MRSKFAAVGTAHIRLPVINGFTRAVHDDGSHMRLARAPLPGSARGVRLFTMPDKEAAFSRTQGAQKRLWHLYEMLGIFT